MRLEQRDERRHGARAALGVPPQAVKELGDAFQHRARRRPSRLRAAGPRPDHPQAKRAAGRRPTDPHARAAPTARRTTSSIIYNGYWFWGRPSVDDLRRDLRELTREIRPDWDLSTPGLRDAWNLGGVSNFHGWEKWSPEDVAAERKRVVR